MGYVVTNHGSVLRNGRIYEPGDLMPENLPVGWRTERVGLGLLVEDVHQTSPENDVDRYTEVEYHYVTQSGVAPWNYDPVELEAVDLHRLNVFISTIDNTVAPFAVRADALAWLSQDHV